MHWRATEVTWTEKQRRQTLTKCRLCGKEFKNKRGLAHHVKKHNLTIKQYYDQHIKVEQEGICLTCGNKTPFLGLSTGYSKYCSRLCFQTDPKFANRLKQYFIKRFGTDNPMKCQSVKQKAKQTVQKRYGVNNVSQLPSTKAKVKKAFLERFGTDNPMKSLKIREKSRKTCLQRYGVDNPSKSEQVKRKIRSSFQSKYGVDNAMQVPAIKKKFKSVMESKYGVRCPSQIPHVKEEQRQKQLDKFRRKLTTYLEYLELELVDNDYKNAHHLHNWKCKRCGTEFKQLWNTIQQGFLCPKCFPRTTSKAEREIGDFLTDEQGLNLILKSRKLIPPLEIDIYIPKLKVAIEVNGLYWHSDDKVDKNYHLNKTLLCQEKGIRLIHVFEDEWLFKQHIVKSRLCYILGLGRLKKIGARQCSINQIDSATKNLFLEENHIQGPDSSVVKLGAFYNKELVAVMTFSHGSLAKGVRLQDPLIWELNRFCTKTDYVISGIAGKMLSYFTKKYEWNKIFSYADLRWSRGDLYRKLGFKLVGETAPNYWYVKGLERIHRFKLRKRPGEPRNIPESVLRAREGYVRVWDCGSLKFELRRN